MKRLLLMFVVATMTVLAVFADNEGKYSISTQIFLDQVNGTLDTDDAPQRARARQLGLKMADPGFKGDQFVAKPDTINGIVYMSAVVRLDDSSASSDLESLGVIVQSTFLDGKLITALIPIDKIGAVSDIAKVNRVRAATMMRPTTKVARQKTNVDDVLSLTADAVAAGLPEGFDGSGVVLGVIDTGIDFNHIAFKDASGNSRIKQAYVYNGSSAQTYSGSQITSTLTDDKSEDHGTHTSSTAGGSSVTVSGTTVTVTDNHANATYGGMAPGADLYLAGVKGLSDTYLTNAVNNMCTYADQQGKPLVVSNSWGSQWGPHDGTGDVADVYNSKFGDSHPNRVALFAASNDGGKSKDGEGGGYHIRGTATSSNPLGAVLRSASYSNTDAGYMYAGLIANAWARNTSVTKLAVKIIVLNANTGAELTSKTITSSTSSVSGLSSYFSGTLSVYYDEIESDKTQVILYSQNGITSRSTSTTTKNGETYYTSNYTLAIQVYPYSGASSSVVDVWGGSYGYFTNHLSTSGYTWTNGSDDMCVSDEAMIANVISVGAYVSERATTNYAGTTTSHTEYTNGDIAYFSSYATAAESPNGVQYPWITAPGARLIAAINHNHTKSVDSEYSYWGDNFIGDLKVNNSTNPYAYMEGTSMATPCAAGIVALWLQASQHENAKSEWKNLTVNKVKQLMSQTAIHDSYTAGTNASHFGNGKIDALAGIAEILDNNSPRITAEPTSLTFSNVTAGTTATKTFTVTGENLEGNISLAKSGNNFSIDKTSITKASDGTASATITVTFAPTANVSANYTGTVTLSSSNAANVTVSLSGNGVYTAPALAANPTSVTFSNTYTSQSATKTVTVTGTNLQGNVSAAISGTNAAMFSVSPTTITQSAATNGATVTITYTPTAAGSHSANLVLTTTGTGANTVTVPITGTATGPSITATPTSLSFTDTYVGETATKTFTVTGVNLSGNITATLNNGAGIYSIDKTSIDKAQAEANGGVTVTVTYSPTAVGQTNASVTLTSTDCNPVTVNLSGTALGPNIAATPTTLAFEGYTGNTYTKTVNVTGNHITGNITATLSGNAAYSIDNTSLSSNGGTITVTYAPTERGNTTATLTLSNGSADDVVINITGEAQGGTITATPTNVAFTGYATRTYTQTVNVSSSNLEQDIAVTLNDAAGIYSIDKTSIDKNTNNVALTITWAPQGAGQTTASITLSSRNADNVTINLSGNAEAATPTIIVDKSNLYYDTQLNEASSQTVTVTGRFLPEDVAVTLTDANNVFTVNKETLDAETLNNEGSLTVTVTFNAATEGTFTGTLNLTSGSATQSVALSGHATDTPTYIYVLTTTLTAGNEYLIVSSNSAGSAYALGHNNATIATDAVTIKSDTDVADAVYIESDDVDDTSVFTAGTSSNLWTFKNGNYYATVSGSGGNRSLQFATSSSNNWTKGTNQLYFKGSRNSYYLRYYNNTFSVNTSSNNIYLYEKTKVTHSPSLVADPVELDFIAQPGESVTETVTVTGRYLTSDVTVTLTDENGVYGYDVTSFSIAEASAGKQVNVTFNAPMAIGSFRGKLTFTSGDTTLDLGLYGSIGTKGTAYSTYLDVAKFTSIGAHSWFSDIADNPYKFTEYPTQDCAWLTLPVMMARDAWLYNDQNWTGFSSNNKYIWQGDGVGLEWSENDIFPGDDYYFDPNSTNIAYGMGTVDNSNTTQYYTYYNVTNCSQVKAYGHNLSASLYSYPTFMYIYELEENEEDGTLTMLDQVDSQTNTTSYNASDVTLTSSTLDPEKIYRVYVGGYRSYFYEVGFKSSIPGERRLAKIVEEADWYQHYKVVADNLIAYKLSSDGKTLYCKDAGEYAEKSVKPDGTVDYMHEIATQLNVGEYDESNWVALTCPGNTFSSDLLGKTLKNVTGCYTDIYNPQIELDSLPAAHNSFDYTPNTFIIPSFGYSEQTSSSGNTTYFFVNPKPMEVATVTWAMWDATSRTFIVPTEIGHVNQGGLEGSINVDFSLYNGTATLEDGHVYSFTALTTSSTSNYSANKISARRAQAASEFYKVYPLEGLTDLGNINDEGVITDVNNIKVGSHEVLKVVYSNPAGQMSDRPFDGVNIVVTIYTDGTREVVKRMF